MRLSEEGGLRTGLRVVEKEASLAQRALNGAV